MVLAITEDHRALADVARSMVTGLAVSDTARSWLDYGGGGRPPFWKDVVAAGWPGIHIGEAHGGAGAGLSELVIVVEEFGRAAAPGPFLSTVLAAAVLDECGTEEQKARWLPELCGGSLTAAVGFGGSARLVPQGIDGDGGPVLAARDADLLMIPVGADLAMVEPGDGVGIKSSDAVDPGRPVGSVTLTGVTVLGVIEDGLAIARRVGHVLAAAEAVGGMVACTEMTVSYVSSREQFGRPVGSFQAVKHQCADMLLDTELAAAAVWDAARPSDHRAESEAFSASAAAFALAAFDRVARRTIQLHGGIAFTWEHEAHLYLRRAMSLSAVFGPEEDLAQEVLERTAQGAGRVRHLGLPAEADRFREGVRAFREQYEQVPADRRNAFFARSGYFMPHWPAPYGRSAGPLEQLVIDEELDGIDGADLGLGEWVLPTILQCGTDEQRDRLLWPSLEGEIRWCQLFSEPGAGSDAAAVATKATRTTGGWLLNGQKVWTSDAQICQRGLATVRTDPAAPKHAGITAMIVDMQAEGVDIRPLREITGESLFNEVFFDDVFVPDADVVGEVNDGWRVARATFGNERISIGGGSTSMQAEALVDLLRRYRPDDSGFDREVGTLLREAHALRTLNLRQVERAVVESEPGVEGSLAKLFQAEHAQRVVDTGLRIAGTAALLGGEPSLVHDLFYTRCLTIAGGTSEILRNQIAERVLGLPREQIANR